MTSPSLPTPESIPHVKINSCSDDGSEPKTHSGDESRYNELQSLWDQQMKNLSPKRRYTKAQVLLFYWDKLDGSYLNTEPEIQALKKVFSEDYNYGVEPVVLNPPGKNSELLMHHKLSGFLLEHNSDDALLIIYYAGHGNPDRESDRNASLNFTGGTPNDPSEADTIAWAEAELMLKKADRADVLLIFDCCFAGLICGVVSRKISTRNFDFIAACAANQLAKPPGEQSFTHALTRSLEQLARNADGFSTSELLTAINNWPTFRKHEQTAFLESRTNSRERMILSPMKEQPESEMATLPLDVTTTNSPAPNYCLTLDFHLFRLPRPEEMTEFCVGFKSFVNDERSIAQRIVWKGLQDMNKTMSTPTDEDRFHAYKFLTQVLGGRVKKRRRSTSASRNAALAHTVPMTPE